MTDNQKIEDLTNAWKFAKRELEEAKELLLKVEYEIWENVGREVPEKGTTNFDSGLKIETGFTEKWAQDIISELHAKWDPERAPFWPFKAEWKKDGKRLELLRETYPVMYAEVMRALELQKKKPAFSVKG